MIRVRGHLRRYFFFYWEIALPFAVQDLEGLRRNDCFAITQCLLPRSGLTKYSQAFRLKFVTRSHSKIITVRARRVSNTYCVLKVFEFSPLAFNRRNSNTLSTQYVFAALPVVCSWTTFLVTNLRRYQ